MGALSEEFSVHGGSDPGNTAENLAPRTVFLSSIPVYADGEVLPGASETVASVMAAVAAHAIARELYTRGMGRDSTLTHLSVKEGLRYISPNAPVLMQSGQSISFDEDGNLDSTIVVQNPNEQGRSVAFGQILYDGNLAIFDFATRDGLQLPTVQDYIDLRGRDPQPSKNDSSASLAIALSVGLVILCLIVLLFVALHRRRQGVKLVLRPHDFGPGLRSLPLGNRPFAAPLEIPLRHLRFGRELGKGSFGRVVEGTLNNRVAVAIKSQRRIDADANTDVQKRMLQEMLVLAQFRGDPHVVQLHGVATRTATLYMVMELCAHGSLADYLRDEQKRGRGISWARKTGFALDICRGMRSVHAAGYLHMDLSARNVLVTADFRCKVSDFGLASKELYYVASKTRPMAVRWMAPEVLRGGDCTRASDVWSFGIVLYELGTNCSAVPFAGLSAAAVVAAVCEGRRPDPIFNMPPHIARVMDLATAAVREERPSFSQLCRWLKRVTLAAAAGPADLGNVPEQAEGQSPTDTDSAAVAVAASSSQTVVELDMDEDEPAGSSSHA